MFRPSIQQARATKLAQRAEEGIEDALWGLASRSTQITDPEDFPGFLCFGGERCGKQRRSVDQEFPAPDSVQALLPRKTARESTLERLGGPISGVAMKTTCGFSFSSSS